MGSVHERDEAVRETWAGWCCPSCAFPLEPLGAGLRCASEERAFASWDGVHRLLAEERRRELQPQLEVLEHARRRDPAAPEAGRFDQAVDVLRRGLGGGGWRLLQPFAGSAEVSVRLAGLGHRVVALDPSVDDRVGLRAAAPVRGLERAEADLEELPLEPAHFDAVVCVGALHHAPRLGRTLVELRRVTRRGGLLVAWGSPVFRRRADGEAVLTRDMEAQAKRYGFALPREQQPGYLVVGELPALFDSAGWTLSVVDWPAPVTELAEDLWGRLTRRGHAGRRPLLVARRSG
jgi:SAM-dependent methyltransferase